MQLLRTTEENVEHTERSVHNSLWLGVQHVFKPFLENFLIFEFQ